MMPKVSIIMPVYNKARYLADALRSVKDQSFSDVELILIDDGSSDDSLKIAQHFAKEDKRFRVYSIPNGGVSHARNEGLSRAVGEYITFMDADDTIHPRYIENLYTCLRENQVDLVISGITKHRDNVVRGNMVCSHIGRFSMDELMPDFAIEQKRCGIFGSCVAKLFSRELAGDLRFDESLRLAEDFDFYLRLYARVKDLYCDDKAYYYYRQETENSSVQIDDAQIDYEAQLRISLRYRAFLRKKQVYSGENKTIVDLQISNYVFLTMFHCPQELYRTRYDAIRRIYLAERIELYPSGLRQKVVLSLFARNMKGLLLAIIVGFRTLKSLLRRS